MRISVFRARRVARDGQDSGRRSGFWSAALTGFETANNRMNFIKVRNGGRGLTACFLVVAAIGWLAGCDREGLNVEKPVERGGALSHRGVRAVAIRVHLWEGPQVWLSCEGGGYSVWDRAGTSNPEAIEELARLLEGQR